ncbi:MAG TPA: FAD binding domain-containing protein [Verrucomicrobiae bacterium]|jgi:xanthine dehydrogenase YagS FAD-binding subunit|nr:FAD binding domain-containing protein [Verrucomicrobiae bacterium]
MRPFEYASPQKIAQVAPLLGQTWGEVEVLAGGTDLLSLMKDEITAPKRLVNIKDVAELRGVMPMHTPGLRIGALTTLAEIADNADVRQHYPALAAAAGDAASPQIRNLATLGGNLCQRPRCWYFRSGHGLLAQGKDGKSLVLDGDNRYHAILGNAGPAYFVSPSTVAPVLIAYHATVEVLGPKGVRSVAAEKFFVIPKNEQEREHDLKPNEIVTAVVLPPSAATHVAAYEVRQKEAFDWPYATAAVALTMNSATVQSARVVLGHVAPVPWVSPEAAQMLVGKNLSPELADKAGQAAVAKARSLGHNEQKIQLARVAVKRAILKAGGLA